MYDEAYFGTGDSFGKSRGLTIGVLIIIKVSVSSNMGKGGDGEHAYGHWLCKGLVHSDSASNSR